MKERLDKIISSQMNISRSNAALIIKDGDVGVNGIIINSPSEKADGEKDEITVNGKKLCYSEFVYIMMNKPAGVVSASKGKDDKTVIDILPESMKRKELFPAGRLDKDTVGFMLITDDGDFAHKILSPKNHVVKTYEATLGEPLSEKSSDMIRNGIVLSDGTVCMNAEVRVIEESPMTVAEIKIHEGKYHQIKRMFAAAGNNVVFLKRTAIGNLPLDSNLKEGECRYISSAELKKIKGND